MKSDLWLRPRVGFFYGLCPEEEFSQFDQFQFVDELLWRGSAQGFPQGKALGLYDKSQFTAHLY